MKAAPLLRAWLSRLRASGVTFHMRHRWLGWAEDGRLQFESPAGTIFVPPQPAVLALGGGSWPKLGSTGSWTTILAGRGVTVSALEPANCGFSVEWSDHFRTRFAGQPVKAVVASIPPTFNQQGEFIITDYGLEGSLIYAASALLREGYQTNGEATLFLDLAPNRSEKSLVKRLSRPRGTMSQANYGRKTINFSGLKAGLLHEVGPPEDLDEPARLAALIKRLPLPVGPPRPLAEAISSAGGVPFEALDGRLQLRAIPGVFCAGEMLDWEAPTGGYLLTACMATGRAAGFGVVELFGR
jgi:uncharacterized flavoprotein (TIGR03862 family)